MCRQLHKTKNINIKVFYDNANNQQKLNLIDRQNGRYKQVKMCLIHILLILYISLRQMIKYDI